MAVTRFDDLIEPMTLDISARTACGRSTSGATDAATKGPSTSTI
jgi:hypothetical protein